MLALVLPALACGGSQKPKKTSNESTITLGKARDAARTGDVEKADRLYETSYQQKARYGTLQEHVDFLISSARFDRAVQLARGFFESESADPRGFELYARALLAAGQAREALDVADQLVQLEDTNPRGHGLRGRALLLLGRADEGIEELQRAVAIDGKSPELLLALGEALLKVNRIDEASLRLRSATRQAPENARAAALLGAALREQGEIEESRQFLDKAIEIDPTDGRAYFELGILFNKLSQQGDPAAKADLAAQAEAALAKAVEFGGDDSTFWYAYGEISRLNKKIDQAATAYRRAVDLKPPHPKAPGKLAMVLMEANRYDEAEVLLTAQLRNDPSNGQNYYYLGAVYAHVRKFKLAIDAYEKFLQLAAKDDRERPRVKKAIEELKRRL